MCSCRLTHWQNVPIFSRMNNMQMHVKSDLVIPAQSTHVINHVIREVPHK